MFLFHTRWLFGACLLCLHVCLDDVERRAAAGDDEIRGRPKMFTPKLMRDFWISFLAHGARRGAFEVLHEAREREAWCVREQNVEVIAV